MIVLHVGLKKAGSASIQSFLATNEQPLRDIGIDYPTIGRLRRFDHNNLANELLGAGKFDASQGTLSELGDYWRRSSADVLVLSAEMLEGCDSGHAARLETLLQRGGEAFRVVIVLRDLIDLVPSSYSQKVKFGGSSHDFDQFFEQRMAQTRVSYYHTAQQWAKVFGWESLRVRALDSAQLLNGDLVDDFVNILGLPDGSARSTQFSKPGLVNTAPGWRVLEAMRSLYAGKHDFPDGHPLADAIEHPQKHRRHVGMVALSIGEAWGWNRDKGRYLTRDQARRCLEAYRSSVLALNEHLDSPLTVASSLDELDFTEREFLPDHTHVPFQDMRRFLDEVADASVKYRKSTRKLGLSYLDRPPVVG